MLSPQAEKLGGNTSHSSPTDRRPCIRTDIVSVNSNESTGPVFDSLVDSNGKKTTVRSLILYFPLLLIATIIGGTVWHIVVVILL